MASTQTAVAHGTGGEDWVRAWPVYLGLLVLAGMWLGPLPAIARRAFSAHMLLHLGVAVVAAPLIAIGLSRTRWGLRTSSQPLAVAIGASMFEMVVVWSWHAPRLHEAAAFHDDIFVLQQASFLLAGLVVWTVAFSRGDRIAAGVGTLTMLFTFAHMAMLGVLLSITPTLIYSPEVCQGAFGFARLDDQHLGGVLMAIGGGMPYLVGGVFLAWRFMSDEAAREAAIADDQAAAPTRAALMRLTGEL